MRKATHIVAASLGVMAGLAGLEHGYFEVLQGNIPTDGLMIASIGPPCVPEEVWNACEPAMTVLPNYLLTGIVAVMIGVFIMVWSAAFLQRKQGGVVLILLSVALLLFGGGIFPPLIGIIGGAAGTQIDRPIRKAPGRITYAAASLWPWPLVLLMTWLVGQFFVGYLFNDFLRSFMWLGLLLILAMLPLSVYSAYAHDATT